MVFTPPRMLANISTLQLDPSINANRTQLWQSMQQSTDTMESMDHEIMLRFEQVQDFFTDISACNDLSDNLIAIYQSYGHDKSETNALKENWIKLHKEAKHEDFDRYWRTLTLVPHNDEYKTLKPFYPMKYIDMTSYTCDYSVLNDQVVHKMHKLSNNDQQAAILRFYKLLHLYHQSVVRKKIYKLTYFNNPLNVDVKFMNKKLIVYNAESGMYVPAADWVSDPANIILYLCFGADAKTKPDLFKNVVHSGLFDHTVDSNVSDIAKKYEKTQVSRDFLRTMCVSGIGVQWSTISNSSPVYPCLREQRLYNKLNFKHGMQSSVSFELDVDVGQMQFHVPVKNVGGFRNLALFLTEDCFMQLGRYYWREFPAKYYELKGTFQIERNDRPAGDPIACNSRDGQVVFVAHAVEPRTEKRMKSVYLSQEQALKATGKTMKGIMLQRIFDDVTRRQEQIDVSKNAQQEMYKPLTLDEANLLKEAKQLLQFLGNQILAHPVQVQHQNQISGFLKDSNNIVKQRAILPVLRWAKFVGYEKFKKKDNNDKWILQRFLDLKLDTWLKKFMNKTFEESFKFETTYLVKFAQYFSSKKLSVDELDLYKTSHLLTIIRNLENYLKLPKYIEEILYDRRIVQNQNTFDIIFNRTLDGLHTFFEITLKCLQTLDHGSAIQWQSKIKVLNQNVLDDAELVTDIRSIIKVCKNPSLQALKSILQHYNGSQDTPFFGFVLGSLPFVQKSAGKTMKQIITEFRQNQKQDLLAKFAKTNAMMDSDTTNQQTFCEVVNLLQIMPWIRPLVTTEMFDAIDCNEINFALIINRSRFLKDNLQYGLLFKKDRVTKDWSNISTSQLNELLQVHKLLPFFIEKAFEYMQLIVSAGETITIEKINEINLSVWNQYMGNLLNITFQEHAWYYRGYKPHDYQEVHSILNEMDEKLKTFTERNTNNALIILALLHNLFQNFTYHMKLNEKDQDFRQKVLPILVTLIRFFLSQN